MEEILERTRKDSFYIFTLGLGGEEGLGPNVGRLVIVNYAS